MMKINFKNNIVTGGFVLAALFLASCVNNEDNFEDFPESQKPVITASTTNFTMLEGETVSIPLDLEYVIDKPIDLQIIATGGSATIFDDYEAGDSAIPAENGNPETGFIARFAPYSESLEIPFTAIFDLMQTEGTETVKLNIAATGVRTAITQDGGININITITDFEYCMWTLDVFDAYGDSWQGGTITVTQNGNTEVFPKEDWDDDAESYEIPIQVGADFDFTYISGTTGTDPNQPGAPAYEEENSYTLTGPDGTEYNDGPVPTVGTIVSGISNCN